MKYATPNIQLMLWNVDYEMTAWWRLLCSVNALVSYPLTSQLTLLLTRSPVGHFPFYSHTK